MKQAISNDENSGSVRLQPCYFAEDDTWAGLEAAGADWLFKMPIDGELRTLESRWLRVLKAKAEMDEQERVAAKKSA
jgi:hypothetical protein